MRVLDKVPEAALRVLTGRIHKTTRDRIFFGQFGAMQSASVAHQFPQLFIRALMVTFGSGNTELFQTFAYGRVGEAR